MSLLGGREGEKTYPETKAAEEKGSVKARSVKRKYNITEKLKKD